MYIFHGLRYSFDSRGAISSYNLAKVGFVLTQQVLSIEVQRADGVLKAALKKLKPGFFPFPIKNNFPGFSPSIKTNLPGISHQK
jgi:hypothetical protein